MNWEARVASTVAVVAMTAISFGAALPSSDSPSWLVAIVGALGGVLAGILLGAITGLVAQALRPQDDPDSGCVPTPTKRK